jgi:hypothetical protein
MRNRRRSGSGADSLRSDDTPILIRVRALRTFAHQDKRFKPRDRFLIPVTLAERWIAAGLVEEIVYGDADYDRLEDIG